MNIEGLDYNTTRERLILPEYGREIQKMVDHAVTIEDRVARQKCAETIIKVMDRMFPHNRENAGYKQKLWDHLAVMSRFELDIDWPYDVNNALKISTKPEPMEYPMNRIPVRHYGHMLFEIFEMLKTMPAGEERNYLARLAALQMKSDLAQWSHGSCSDDKVIADLERLTDGAVKLTPRDIQSQRTASAQPKAQTEKKRKKNRNH